MLAYLSYRFSAFIVRRAPRRVSSAFESMIARLFHFFRPRVRGNTRRNLDAAGSGASTIEVFRFFARSTGDFLMLGSDRGKALLASCRFEGRGRLDEALARGGGAILFLPHLGPWEAAGAYISSLGYQLNTVALEHQSPAVTRFFGERRRSWGIAEHAPGESTTRLLDALHRGEIVVLLVDRNLAGRGVETTFLGRRAMLPDGHVVLAARAGAPLFPCRCRYGVDGAIEILVDDPIDSTGDTASTVEACVRRLEVFVRENPEQWFAFDHVWLEGD